MSSPILKFMDADTQSDWKDFPVDLSDPVQIRYLKAMMRKEFPESSVEEIGAAVDACDPEDFSKTREEILECVRIKLAHMKEEV